ncbi:LuxR C-terminal-related transcriptional regulator [Streptomyces sp. NBC_00989]|uniref:LuxR C-terminal-related transcriptional regulator n=1 Tax=Streptomyces sp. NBC_00989 TaxID=2903705 RepID=UPI00386C852E|nr:LuxR C-terminal-related transcriptional regulator [Streptomyces sp. NBC_00989]
MTGTTSDAGASAIPPEHRDATRLLAAEAAWARAGAGRLVLLRGATGTGRTTVLEATVTDALAHGMRVLRARCSPRDRAVPYATVLQLMAPVPEFGDTASAGDERANAELFRRVLHSYADRAPLLIAVDDVHLADPASHRWLVESARHVDRLRILLVATERSQYDVDPSAPGLTHTLSPALVRTLTLAPLTANSAAELVGSAHPDAPESWVEDCVRAGAGNPLLLRALLDDLGAGRHTSVPTSSAALYPGAYPAAVSWWLDSAGPATGEVARALAALDEGWDGGTPRDLPSGHATGPAEELAAVIAELAGADPARVTGWLTAMSGLGVLRPDPDGRPRYAHPLLRDAVLTGVPATRRRAAHAAAAETMQRHGVSPDTVARQLLLSDPVGEPWTSAALQEAASLALRDGRTSDATAFLRRVLEEPLPDARRQRLLTELGSLEYKAQTSSAGIPRLSEALRLSGAPQDTVRAAVALGTALAGRGRTVAAVDVLRTVEDELTDRPQLIRILQTASVLLSEQDQTVRKEVYRWLCDAAELSPELVGTAGHALVVRHAATAGLISAAEAMRRVRALLAQPADPLTEPFLIGTAAAVAQWADELPEAERLVERGLVGQRPDLLHPMHEALANVRADILAARGEHARLLAEPCPRDRARTGPSNRQSHVLLSLVATGEEARALRLANGFDLRSAPDSWELNRFLYARGVARAATGDTAGALHDFLECGRRQSAREVVSPVVTPWRTAAAECRLALARPREAVALAEEELRLARVWNTPRTMGRSLRVLAAATGGRRGLELAEEAVRLLRGGPVGTEAELVSALVTQGRGLTAAGDRGRARACLREAAERAERLGATRQWALAEEALGESGARRSAPARTGSDSLTTSERRIAELAADGRTNTEIADLLHLARRTVETHLTSSYRKLGIRRRGELPGTLGRPNGR